MAQWYRRRPASRPRSSLALLLLLLGAAPAGARPAGAEERSFAAPLPLVFVEIPGAEGVLEARTMGLRATFTAAGFVLDAGEEIALRFEGARAGVRVRGAHPLAGRIHRLVGPRAGWIRNAPAWGAVRYEGLYAGIDLEVAGREGRLEYDLLFQADARLEDVVVRVERRAGGPGAGEAALLLQGDGSLLLGGGIAQRAPRSRQTDAAGRAVEPPSAFRILDGGRFGFAVEGRDPALPLVVDPVLVYGRHVGGSHADEACGVAIDSAGAVYVAGSTRSSDFPLAGTALDGTRAGRDGVIFKLDPAGLTLEWATFFGGKGDERGLALRVNASGEAFVAGETTSDDFPATAGARGGSRAGGADAFVLSLAADGAALRFATLLGGKGDDTAQGLALGAGGDVFVAGTTSSADFPTTSYAWQTARRGVRDAFVAKLDASGAFLHYATYLGGLREEEGRAIAVDPAGHAFVAGRTGSTDFPVTLGALDGARAEADAFVTKLSADGSALLISTFLGGSRADEATAIAHLADETILVAGWTRSPDFPVHGAGARGVLAGRQDGFVSRLTAAGASFVTSTLIGGARADECLAADADPAGGIWAAGWTESEDFPTTSDAPQPARGGGSDGFVVRLAPAGGDLVWGTFLGRGGDEVLRALAVDPFRGEVAVAGDAADVPPSARGTLGGRTGASDAFVTRIAPGVCGAPAGVEVLGGGTGPSLGAGPARLGGELVLVVAGAAPEARGLLVVGEEEEPPAALDGSGAWFVDRRTGQPLLAFRTDESGGHTVRLRLPSAPGWCGRRLVVQGIVLAPGAGPLRFGQVTDALRFTLGD
ncbi:MAG: hypothetical protein AB1726_15020 [Planctomycetota bacterium]